MGYELSDELLQNFVPAQDRGWYPFNWPTRKQQLKLKTADPEEYQRQIDIIRKLAREDFFFFCEVIMRDPNDQPLYPGVHDELCHLIQSGEDIIILMPRNHLKSTICSIAYPVWLLGQNPDLRIVIFSDIIYTSKKFIRSIQQHILNNKRLRLVFPKLKPASSSGLHKYLKWNETEIIVERANYRLKENSITAGSTEQVLTGIHCEHMIFDDVVTAKNANGTDNLEKISAWEEDVIHLIDFANRMLYIGTRYHDLDLYGKHIDKNTMPVYRRKYMENGKYIWPFDQNIKRIEKIKDNTSAYNFACQYNNDPIQKETQEFIEDWFVRWNYDLIRREVNDDKIKDLNELNKKWISKHNRYIGMDPNRAQKKRKVNDFCVIMAVGIDLEENIYIYDFYRDKPTGSLQITEIFCDWIDKWNPIKAGVEVFGGDAHLLEPIRKEMKLREIPTHKLFSFDVKSGIAWEDRVRDLQIYFQWKKVYMGKGGKWNELEEELLRFPYAKHNDLILTLANIVSQLIKAPKKKIEVPKETGWRANLYPSNEYSWMLA